MGWWPGAREVILWILLQHGMMVTTAWKIMIEGSIRVVPDASGYHCRYIRIGNSLASYHISFCKPRSESDCFLVIQNAVSPSVCKPCSESNCFLVFQSTACDSPSVSASPVQNQTVFSGLAERGQWQPLCVCKPCSESDSVFWSCRMRSVTAPMCLQAMFRIRQCFLVLQNAVSDSPYVSASPVQNQTVFSGLAECGQWQPLCVCKPCSESDSVFWSCRVRSVTAPMCLQAMFRIRQCFLVLQNAGSDSPYVSASHVQNQTVFSGLAECGQWQPLCVCKPCSESDSVFWSCRMRSVTAPMCLQAMFRIRQCFLVLQNAVSDSPYVSASHVQNQTVFSGLAECGQWQPLCVCKPCSESDSVFWSCRTWSVTAPMCLQAMFRIRQCFLVLQSAVSDSPYVSASHVQNQTVFSGLAECGQRQPLCVCKPCSESDSVFWSCRARSVTAPMCLQAMFRIRQCFLVLQNAGSDSPYVSASHVQNQTVFSGLAECGQRQPLCVCKPCSESDSVFWSCRMRSVTAPMCLQAMFRIRQCFLVLQNAGSDSPYVSASHVQNQTVFSGLAECGQWQPLCVCKPCSESDSVFWSCRMRSVTAPMCLQAMFRIRQCFLVLQNAVSDSPYVSASHVQNQTVFSGLAECGQWQPLCVCKPCSESDSVFWSCRTWSVTAPMCLQAMFRIRQCFLVLQSAVSDSPYVSASHVQNQTVFSGLAECGQRQPLCVCKPCSESDSVFWSCRARSVTAPMCLQAMFRIRQCFLVLQNAGSDSPYVSASHVQNQTVFSGLAECGQRQPLCVCKPCSESDCVFWSCRMRSVTAPMCLQAMFRIRQCFLVLQNAGSDSPSVPVQLLTARNIQRPQLSFRDKIDNSNNPFVPVIAFKPHALKSLQGQHLMTDFEWTA